MIPGRSITGASGNMLKRKNRVPQEIADAIVTLAIEQRGQASPPVQNYQKIFRHRKSRKRRKGFQAMQ